MTNQKINSAPDHTDIADAIAQSAAQANPNKLPVDPILKSKFDLHVQLIRSELNCSHAHATFLCYVEGQAGLSIRLNHTPAV